MNNKELKQYTYLTMEEFIRDYLDIDHIVPEDRFPSLAKLSHQNLTELMFKYVKRVPFDIIDSDEILRGDIILVADGRKGKKPNLGAYIRPEILRNEELNIIKKEKKNDKF